MTGHFTRPKQEWNTGENWYPRIHPVNRFRFTRVIVSSDEKPLKIAKAGLTDWVAKNFELLNLGEPPYESRVVDSLTRARWKQSAMDILERWMAPHATRHIIRRTMDGRDGPTFMMFPHPEDAVGMNLQGRNAELPCALFSLTDQGVIRVFNFRSERITHIEPTDLIATVGFDEQDAYSASGWIAAPTDFLNILRIQSSQIMETEKELEDWFAYLDWMNTCSTRMHGPERLYRLKWSMMILSPYR